MSELKPLHPTPNLQANIQRAEQQARALQAMEGPPRGEKWERPVVAWQGQLARSGPTFRVLVNPTNDEVTVEKRGLDGLGETCWYSIPGPEAGPQCLGQYMDVVLKCIRDQHTAVQQIHRQLQQAQAAKAPSDPTRNPD